MDVASSPGILAGLLQEIGDDGFTNNPIWR